MNFKEMIDDCTRHPVRSRHHDWQPGEQQDYDSLKVGGRRLYDNLRTKHDLPHIVSFNIAKDIYGTK